MRRWFENGASCLGWDVMYLPHLLYDLHHHMIVPHVRMIVDYIMCDYREAVSGSAGGWRREVEGSGR